jgi:hypothetical protein
MVSGYSRVPEPPARTMPLRDGDAIEGVRERERGREGTDIARE